MSENNPALLTVPSEPTSLSVVRAFVESLCLSRDVDRATVQAVVLATSEAVTNIVRHAHRDLPCCSFQVQCSIGEEIVEVVFVDEGAPFDLEHVPQLNPGEMRIGGRGVYLMRTLMDEVICEAMGAKGNRLRMVKRRPDANQTRDCG